MEADWSTQPDARIEAGPSKIKAGRAVGPPETLDEVTRIPVGVGHSRFEERDIVKPPMLAAVDRRDAEWPGDADLTVGGDSVVLGIGDIIDGEVVTAPNDPVRSSNEKPDRIDAQLSEVDVHALGSITPGDTIIEKVRG